MRMHDASDFTAPKSEKQALRRLKALGDRLLTEGALDHLLSQDAGMRDNPALCADTKALIQSVCPHLRAN